MMSKLWHLACLIAVWLPAQIALAAPVAEPGVGLPRDISLEGWRIDWLLKVTNFFIIVMFVAMCIWMLIAMVKHNRKHKAEYDHGTSHHSIVVAMFISVFIFVVVDGNLFYNSMIDINEAFWNFERASGKDVVRIEVNARQWAWELRYQGPDGKFATKDDIVTLNEMVVPVDTPVAMQLRAIDVIHSFYLPNLRIKSDAVPGTTTRMWFQVDSNKLAAAGPGNEFSIACAQHCGTHHYKMGGVLKVLSKRDFEAWQKEAAINAELDYEPPGSAADIKKGIALEAKYGPHWGWPWEAI